MRKIIQSTVIILLLIHCEIVNFDPTVEKDKCKITFAYRINVSEQEKKRKEFPLFLYLMYNEYRYCMKIAEELPLPKF